MCLRPLVFIRCFFAIPATTEIYTLSLHDALPIWSKPLLFTVGLRNRFTLCVPALKQLQVLVALPNCSGSPLRTSNREVMVHPPTIFPADFDVRNFLPGPNGTS